MNGTDRLLAAIRSLAAGDADARDHALVEEAHPADIAGALRELPLVEQVAVFRGLTQERAGEVLSELDDDALLQLVRALDEVEVSRILDEMPPKHAADVVEELPTEQAEKILDLMQEEKSEEIQEILEYPEHSAGRLMSPDFVAVNEAATVEEAIDHIRKSASQERAFDLYVVDDHRHLVGVVPLRRLLTASPASPVFAVRDENVVSVSPEMDQEDVARLVAKYDLVTVPVVDARQHLVGTIAVDNVLDIVGEEASEDIFRIAGSDAAELERRSPGQVALMRLPWVLATLLIELGAGVVIHYFDATLSRVILLASFMPVIQAHLGQHGAPVGDDGGTRAGDGAGAAHALVGAAPPADADVEHPGRRMRPARRGHRGLLALAGLRPRRGGLDVHLGQPVGHRRHGHPHAVQAPRLRSRPHRGAVRDGVPGRARHHDLPLPRDRAHPLAGVTADPAGLPRADQGPGGAAPAGPSAGARMQAGPGRRMPDPVIVLIEDEPQIRRFLRVTLTGEGYRLFEAGTGADGLVEVATRQADVVIIDLGLPDMDGLEVIRRVREWSAVPIIVLSARGQERDKVAALDAGADDYIGKPFGAGELLARVRVALRHGAGAAREGEEAPFTIGDLKVDRLHRRVFVGATEVRLTPIEYRLLVTLVKHAGKVLTHQQLLREVWGPGHTEQAHYLRVYMAHLRHKLEAEPARPRYLLTEPGVGYRLAAE